MPGFPFAPVAGRTGLLNDPASRRRNFVFKNRSSRRASNAPRFARACATPRPECLALLAAGLRAPRYIAALADGLLMIAGTVYIVFIADDFLGPFIGFLITLGVPIAAWCGRA